MKRKQLITSIVVIVILAGLVYLQVKAWRHFDWATFWKYTESVNVLGIIAGVLVIHSNYFLRATRWRVFLRSRQSVKALDLVPSQIIGFTGLALLGRPGEFIRPYLVSRKVNLSFTSQLVVWTAERLCDMFSVAILLGIALIYRPEFRNLFVLPAHRTLILSVGVGGLLALGIIIRFVPAIHHRFSRLIQDLSRSVAHDLISFVEIAATSLGMWVLIAFSYWLTLHSYRVYDPTTHAPLISLRPTDIPLIMGASTFGSIIQLPGVGGGSQLAVISVLSSSLFHLPQELATSAGIMLWLVTFASVTPTGLFLAHREKLSLTRLSSESQKEEEAAEAAT